jgi:hypothetical protein
MPMLVIRPFLPNTANMQITESFRASLYRTVFRDLYLQLIDQFFLRRVTPFKLSNPTQSRYRACLKIGFVQLGELLL